MPSRKPYLLGNHARLTYSDEITEHTWVTAYGSRIPVSQIEDDHLWNIIKMLHDRSDNYAVDINRPETLAWLAVLETEFHQRRAGRRA